MIDQPLPTHRRRELSRWWWVLAGLGLTASAIPTLTLIGVVVTGDARASVPPGRLAELLYNTLTLAAAVTVSAVAIGLATSWVTTRTDLPGARLLSIVVTLPLVMPSYVVALTLLGAGGQDGVMTTFLRKQDADKFAAKVGGKVIGYEEAIASATG